jgi:N utilization substance protein A
MNYELLEALNQIAREKNVDREVLIETMMAGLLQAARRRYGPAANIDIRFDKDRGRIDATLTRRVVEEPDDEGLEISLDEAREINAAVEPGHEVSTPLDIALFGRMAASAAKHVLVQRVREAERERVYDEFHGRVGDLVHGIVQQVERRNVLIRVDGVEAILLEREALHRDRFRQGDHVTTLLLEVDRMAKGPQLILSRAHPDFLKRLFESEVPEIAEKIVEIRSVSREPGSRSKVGVYSNDDRVDAVGACVGVKGSRVQNIVRELGGERIDIVPWSSDTALFVTRALSPAKVQRVDVHEDRGAVTVVVAEDQLSLAIGKGGQNVRLATKLTGWTIELVSDAQLAEDRAVEEIADFDLEEVGDRIGPKVTEKLIQAGLERGLDVLKSGTAGLQEIEGVGPKIAQKILDLVREEYDGRLERARRDRQGRREGVPSAASVGDSQASSNGGAASPGAGESHEAASGAEEVHDAGSGSTDDNRVNG